MQLSKKTKSSTVQETSKVKAISAVQRQRLDLVNKVCQSYRDDQNFKDLYVDKPGSKIRGKFTLEPKSKLVMCNVMKQGRELQCSGVWAAVARLCYVAGTTTWARIFIQLYLPNAANWRAKKWVEFSPFNVGYQVKLATKLREVSQYLEKAPTVGPPPC